MSLRLTPLRRLTVSPGMRWTSCGANSVSSEMPPTSKLGRSTRCSELHDRCRYDAEVALPARVLHGIRSRSPLGDVVPLPPLPATPFSQSDLLVNAEGQPNIGSELRAELASADSVDLLCAFVIWSGVRHLRDALAASSRAAGSVRVITTTYMGATEKRAVDELVALGRRGARRVRRADHEAPREGMAARARVRADDRVHRLVEPVAHGAVRRARMERPALVDRCRARDRPRTHDVREPLGVRALRAVRPGRQRRRARAGAAASTIGDRSGRSRRSRSPTSTCGRIRTSSGCSRRSRSSESVTIDTATSSSRRPGPARRSWPRSTIDSSSSSAAATCRCSSSRTARRSSGSRWRPTVPSCATGRSARSTAAAGSPTGGTCSR